MNDFIQEVGYAEQDSRLGSAILILPGIFPTFFRQDIIGLLVII